MAFDGGGAVFYTQQDAIPADQQIRRRPMVDDVAPLSSADAKRMFKNFIKEFRRKAPGSTIDEYVYTDQLRRRYGKGEHFLEVELEDLTRYDQSKRLHDAFQQYPHRLMPVFEEAIREELRRTLLKGEDEAEVPHFQLLLRAHAHATTIRDVTAREVNRLLVVPGIVISAQRSRPFATHLHIRCRNCNHTKVLVSSNPFAAFQLPRVCEANLLVAAAAGNPAADERKCPVDPYIVEADKTRFMDHQLLKLQEAPDDVPTGEMPRQMLLSVNRFLVDKVAPGTRVQVVGIHTVKPPSAKDGTVRSGFLQVVGIRVMSEGSGRAVTTFTPEEEGEFVQFAKNEPYRQLTENIAPSVRGSYTDDIKKAIACLLVGGSRRVLPDGMKLRGDINVLLLGDPSTAKSQFLKFVEKVAPVGVYTSGKGSSAAGLTASVVKDHKGDFALEGGAMVLADGGVVCIDEFDKMREEDRVAIHEAMEQQTISVAKAGITTILNSRASVLAAANPVFGRYDDRHSAAENIEFVPTILSRFDLIFIVRDVRDEARDKDIARHVMGLHMAEPDASADDLGSDDLDLLKMKKYISYCRTRCAPRLSDAAAASLQGAYVQIRQQFKQGRDTTTDKPTIPITVRQLEAIIRISESIAKMRLSRVVTKDDVAEAVRLFQVSTMHAAQTGGGELSPEMLKDVHSCEERIVARLAVGSAIATNALVKEFTEHGMDPMTTRKAIDVLVKQERLTYQAQRRQIVRKR